MSTTAPGGTDVTAVIVNYNGACHLEPCIQSLRRQSVLPQRIVVVDNASTDDSAAICHRLGVEFLPLGSNDGLGAAYNRGVAVSTTEFVLLLNNDLELDDQCLEELSRTLNETPSAFAADPLQQSWDRTQIIHYCCTLRASESVKDLAVNPFCILPALKRVFIKHDAPGRLIPFASAGAMMVRASLFRRLGGFDEKFFLDWEDVDLCWRANLMGHPCVFVPTAILRHKWGGSTKIAARFTRNRLRMDISQNYNMMRFAVKCLDAKNAFLFPLVRLALAPAYFVKGSFAYASCIVIAVGKLLITLPDVLARRWHIQRNRTNFNNLLLDAVRDDQSEYRLIWPAPTAAVSYG